ncbi:class I SAM-dependent methyltransferase [Methylibium sp.]|uniref:class I SAM-dependent methyltransferase n=1 Tax=Methylibium sp. TaxID=2067992 RepID=UPI003D137D58
MNTTAFVALALARPGLVGAVAPSSRRLARAMAAQVGEADALIELGAGTGAVTSALRHAAPTTPLLAVELQANLAAGLQQRFPDVEVACAAAHEVLAQHPQAPADTVLVSSLPFRSLPEPLRSTTLRALLHFIETHPKRRLVQYTYQPRAPFELPAHCPLRWSLREVVWRNLPPAGVWVLRSAAD